MTNQLNSRKYRLIQQIVMLEDERMIDGIERQLSALSSKGKLWPLTVKPLRKRVTLNDMIAEQQYQPSNWERFCALTNELAIEEPLENLLAQLDE